MKEIIDLSDDESTSSKETASSRKNLGLKDGEHQLMTLKGNEKGKKCHWTRKIFHHLR